MTVRGNGIILLFMNDGSFIRKGGAMARIKSQTKGREIIQAAMELFAEKGFFYTNVKEIAERANVGVGTVYIYFDNKDNILIELFIAFLDRVIRDIQTILDTQLHPLEKFKRVLRTVAEILSENMDMARVFLVELRQTTEALSYLAPKLEKEYNFLIKKLLQEAKDQGYVRQDINVHIVSIASLGLIEALLFDWVTNKYSKEKLFSMFDQAIEYFVFGFEGREHE